MTPNPQDSAVALEVEREAFEAWASRECPLMSLVMRRDNGNYADSEATKAWEGFKAGRASLSTSKQAGVEPVAECRDCHGTGVDGDCGPDGRTIDVECGACNGTGRTHDAWQVAIERLERVFQKSVVGMVGEDYATGYTEALSHVRRALAATPPAVMPAAPSDAVNAFMFMVYEYARISDGIDSAEGEARSQQLAAMRAKGNEIRAALASETASDQMLGRYAIREEEIRDLLDQYAPDTSGNIVQRVRSALSQTMQPQAAPLMREALEKIAALDSYGPAVGRIARAALNGVRHTESVSQAEPAAGEQTGAVAMPALSCKHSNRSDCGLFGMEEAAPVKFQRPSREWYAAKIAETLDDDFVIGTEPLAAPGAAIAAREQEVTEDFSRWARHWFGLEADPKSIAKAIACMPTPPNADHERTK